MLYIWPPNFRFKVLDPKGIGKQKDGTASNV
jgi:hypothetical protein